MSGLLGAVGLGTGALTAGRGLTASVGNLGQTLAALGAGTRYGVPGFGLGLWAQGMLPASWRGVPFAVRRSQLRFGRRVAVHEYPFRDYVWVEDLGRAQRLYRFSAFLVGDDVFDQLRQLRDAAEQAGPATLVHPVVGSVTAALLDCGVGESTEAGRVLELDLAFVEALAHRAYPSTAADTAGASASAADQTVSVAAADFASRAGAALLTGVDAVNAGIATVGGYIGIASGFVADGARIAGAVAGVGTYVGAWFGRYDTAPAPSIPTVAAPDLSQPLATRTSAAVSALLAASTTAATGVTTAGSAFLAAAQGDAMATSPTGFAGAAAAVAEAVRAAATDPRDQIRQLSGLAAFAPAQVQSGTAPIAQAMASVQMAVGALCRRTALASLARACAAYQPSSYDDAVQVRSGAAVLFDAEIVSAADGGDSDSYLALRALRTAMVQDLTLRGAALPHLLTVTRPQPLPALLLAWQLYHDAGRADDLIARAAPVHPAFMPLSFEALSA